MLTSRAFYRLLWGSLGLDENQRHTQHNSALPLLGHIRHTPHIILRMTHENSLWTRPHSAPSTGKLLPPLGFACVGPPSECSSPICHLAKSHLSFWISINVTGLETLPLTLNLNQASLLQLLTVSLSYQLYAFSQFVNISCVMITLLSVILMLSS